MNKLLLAGVSAIALATVAAPASATYYYDPANLLQVSVGLSQSYALELYNDARFNATGDNKILDDSGDGAQGVLTIQQNSGLNSSVGASTAVAAILNCDCADTLLNIAVAGSGVASTVFGNVAFYNWTGNNKIDGSLDRVKGVVTVQQNSGLNSAVQASTAVAAIIGKPEGHSRHDVDPILGLAVALSYADAVVVHNYAIANYTGDNTIRQSLDGSQGVFTVQQNSGANSSVHASTSVAAILNCDCSDTFINAAVAASGQGQYVVANGAYGNWTGDNTIDNSLTHAKGVFTLQQNSGVNSTVQASTSVAAISGRR